MQEGQSTSKLLITAGNISLDDTVNPDGETTAAPGGDALYSAIGAAIWRYPVAILSRVGSDYPAEFMTRMAREGIGISMIRSLDGPTVHYRITNSESGGRLYEHLTPERRQHELSPQGSDLDSVRHAKWVHVAAMPINVQSAVVSRCRIERVPYSLDPHDEYIVGHEEHLADLIRGSIFMPSQLELGLLFPDLRSGQSPQAMAQAAAPRLLAMGARAVAIKLGATGSFVADSTYQAVIPSLPIPARDSTGAGDAFCGGFLAGYLRTDSLLLGASCGTVSAGQVIRGFGAFHSERPTGSWLRRKTTHLLRQVEAGNAASALVQDHFPWLVDREYASCDAATGSETSE